MEIFTCCITSISFSTQTICSNESSFTYRRSLWWNYAGAGVVNNNPNPSLAQELGNIWFLIISFGDTTYSLTDTLTVLMSRIFNLAAIQFAILEAVAWSGIGYSSYLWNTGETTSHTVDSATITNNNQTFGLLLMIQMDAVQVTRLE